MELRRQRLEDRDYCQSEEFDELNWLVWGGPKDKFRHDLWRNGKYPGVDELLTRRLDVPVVRHPVYPDAVLRFRKAIVEFCREKYGIPLYCRDMWSGGVSILHCQYRDALSREDWAIIGYLGKSAGAYEGGLSYHWGGDWPEFRPDIWAIAADITENEIVPF